MQNVINRYFWCLGALVVLVCAAFAAKAAAHIGEARYLGDPEHGPVIIQGARVVPSMKNGKPDGFKLYAIRPNSAIARLGLANGDTLQSVNGIDLTSADKALEVYTKLREATSLEVEVMRRGQPVKLNYSIK